MPHPVIPMPDPDVLAASIAEMAAALRHYHQYLRATTIQPNAPTQAYYVKHKRANWWLLMHAPTHKPVAPAFPSCTAACQAAALQAGPNHRVQVLPYWLRPHDNPFPFHAWIPPTEEDRG
jgi:hypothetical protein